MTEKKEIMEQNHQAISHYMRIQKWIRQKIEDGSYKTGDILPTERELAELHGVSRITIRQAIKELEVEHIVVRIPRRGVVVSPDGHLDASSETVENIGKIAFICSDMNTVAGIDPFYLQILSSLNQCARDHQMPSPILFDSHDLDRFPVFLERLKKDNISGAIISGGISYSKLLTICEHVGNIVLAGTAWKLDNVPSVIVPAAQGGLEVTRHLLNLGCKKLAFAGRTMRMPHIWPDEQKYLHSDGFTFLIDGFIKAHREAGVEVDQSLIENINFDISYQDNVSQAIRRLLQNSNRPDGIVCCNDQVAAIGLQIADQLALRVPDDVAIVGFDNQVFSKYLKPKLTTISIPTDEIGQIAGSILIKQMKGETITDKVFMVKPKLVIRESCGSRSAIAQKRFASSNLINAT